MRLVRVKFKHFRVFYGEHEIFFSTSPTHPITLVIGKNGSGKTSFMNAIFWAFSGRFSPRLENPEFLIHTQALDEGATECYVELEFDHNGDRRLIRRTKTKLGRTELRVDAIDRSGLIKRLAENGDAQDYLDTILPSHLANWFIFDGEAVGDIDLSGSPRLKRSLHQTFGFEDTADLISHLTAIASDYAKAIAGEANDSELAALNDVIEAEERRLARHLEDLTEATQLLLDEEKNEELYSQQLAGLDQSSQLEANRRKAQELFEGYQAKLQRERATQIDMLNRLSVPVVIEGALKPVIDLFMTVAEAQDIPAAHSEILVNRILKDKRCICGTPVEDGTAEFNTVKSLLETASTQAMAVRLQRLNEFAIESRRLASGYTDTSDACLKNIAFFENRMHEQKEALRVIERELDGVDNKKVSELKDKRRTCSENIQRYSRTKGYLDSEIASTRRKISDFVSDRERLITKSERNSTLKRNRSKVQKFLAYVKERFEAQEDEVLKALSNELSGATEKFLTKNLRIELAASNYEIVVKDIDGRPTSLSTGERHIVTFIFVAAIVGMAAKRNKFSKVNWISDPIVAPLVLDAPFSVQDELYRTRAASQIAEQVEQSVLMFAHDVWKGELREALESKVGRFYAIVNKAKGPAGDKGFAKLVLSEGNVFALNSYESDRDESFFQEVPVNA